MVEKRSIKRRHLIFYLRVFDSDSQAFLGFLGDISQDGMMLIAEHPMEAGQQLNIEMRLPQAVFGQKTLMMQASVRRTSPDVNPDFHVVGLQLKDLSAEDVALIGELVERVGFKD